MKGDFDTTINVTAYTEKQMDMRQTDAYDKLMMSMAEMINMTKV